MSTHNICFHGEIRKILTRYPLLSRPMVMWPRCDSNLRPLDLQSVRIENCVEVLRPSQPNGVMSSAVSLPNHTFTGQA